MVLDVINAANLSVFVFQENIPVFAQQVVPAFPCHRVNTPAKCERVANQTKGGCYDLRIEPLKYHQRELLEAYAQRVCQTPAGTVGMFRLEDALRPNKGVLAHHAGRRGIT